MWPSLARYTGALLHPEQLYSPPVVTTTDIALHLIMVQLKKKRLARHTKTHPTSSQVWARVYQITWRLQHATPAQSADESNAEIISAHPQRTDQKNLLKVAATKPKKFRMSCLASREKKEPRNRATSQHLCMCAFVSGCRQPGIHSCGGAHTRNNPSRTSGPDFLE